MNSEDKANIQSRLESLNTVRAAPPFYPFPASMPEALPYVHVSDWHFCPDYSGQVIMRVINITSDPALITIRFRDGAEMFGSVPLLQAKLCATSQDIIQEDQMFYTIQGKDVLAGGEWSDTYYAVLGLVEIEPVSLDAPKDNKDNEMRAEPVPAEDFPLYVAQGDVFAVGVNDYDMVLLRTIERVDADNVTIKIETSLGKSFSKTVSYAQAVSVAVPTDYYRDGSNFYSVVGKTIHEVGMVAQFDRTPVWLRPHEGIK